MSSSLAAVIPITSRIPAGEPTLEQVSQFGDHTLYRVSADEYQLVGPGPNFSLAWLVGVLPPEDDGEWLTEWMPTFGFTMRITRQPC